MLMIMGDFNARVGNDLAPWWGAIGRFVPEKQNENVVRLLDFCALNDQHSSGTGLGSTLENPLGQGKVMLWTTTL